MARKFTLLVASSLLLTGLNGFTQSSNSHILLEKNIHQYPSQVLYASEIPGGKIFIESKGLTYNFYNVATLHNIHEVAEHSGNFSKEEINNMLVGMHGLATTWEGASFAGQVQASGQQSFFRNYFIGNDPAKWSSEVPMYNELLLKNVYPGIDLRCKGQDGNFKQDWIIAPTKDPLAVRIKFEGADHLSLDGNDLLIGLSTGDYKELAPYAYQEINGNKVEVACKFHLAGKILSFEFPQGYNINYALVIDPVLVGSTYSGSTATVYGHSATYDDLGNIYAGGRAFGVGYPVTVGAYQTSFGGSVDISISKYSPNATTLLYATYIGGSSDEYVHSMFVSAATNELFLMGSASSSNYPVTNGSFQTNHGGGGCDIIISRLNPAGSTLMASTFVGGNATDGQNQIYSNYGDTYRGEIILASNGDVLIVSFASSPNFPVTNGSYDMNQSGGQDGVVFRMPANLSSMVFSTFIGGSGDDAAYGIRIDGSGNYLLCGGTSGTGFPSTPGVLHNTFQGGNLDGWLATLSANGASLLNATFYGTPTDDQIFFLDTDNAGNVSFLGQTNGTFNVTNGCYSQPNGSLFNGEVNPALTVSNYITIVGTSTLSGTISPTAFLVDQCDKVYVSGWGSTAGLQVANNAIQPNTDGDDFYLLVLDQNASAFLYGTYYGTTGWEHVDGGTSRFDKRGVVYQSICEGSMGLNTTPGAYSPNNQAGSYDIAVFKIDFDQQGVTAGAGANPSTSGCAPFQVNFINTSTNAVDYIWNFDDGSPFSTQFQPGHVFQNPGTYTVMLVAIDSNSCNIADTAYVMINVGSGSGVTAGFAATLTNSCGVYSLVLQDTSSNGHVYDWNFGDNTVHSTLHNPSHIYLSEGPFTITLIVEDTICNAVDTVTQVILFDTAQTSPVALFTYTQLPGCAIIEAGFNNQSQNAHTYSWDFGDGNLSAQQNPNHVYSGVGSYYVILTATDTVCDLSDSYMLQITLDDGFDIDLGPDGEFCDGQRVNIDATLGGAAYLWSTGETTAIIEVDQSGIYWVAVTLNNCVAYDSIYLFPYAHAIEKDTLLLCPGDGLKLHAGPGQNYQWFNGATTESITVIDEGLYYFQMTKGYCHISDSVLVKFRRQSPDVFIPNTFSPNEDGLNEEFLVVGADKDGYEMRIFNRWGDPLYYSNNPVFGWNGTHNGKVVPTGVYVWKIAYKNECMSPPEQVKLGKINVLR